MEAREGEVSFEMSPDFLEDGDWESVSLEARLVSLVAEGKGCGGGLVFSHAARVAWSTGHASAGDAGSLDIVSVMRGVGGERI